MQLVNYTEIDLSSYLSASTLGTIAGFGLTSLTAPVPDYPAGLAASVRGLRIGIDAAYNETDSDFEIIATVREAGKLLENLGAVIKEVTLPDPAAAIAAWGTCSATGAASPMRRPVPPAPQSTGGLPTLSSWAAPWEGSS